MHQGFVFADTAGHKQFLFFSPKLTKNLATSKTSLSSFCCLELLCFSTMPRLRLHMKRFAVMLLLLLLEEIIAVFSDKTPTHSAAIYSRRSTRKVLGSCCHQFLIHGLVLDGSTFLWHFGIKEKSVEFRCLVWQIVSNYETQIRNYLSLEVWVMLASSKSSGRRPASFRRRILLRNHISHSLERLMARAVTTREWTKTQPAMKFN